MALRLRLLREDVEDEGCKQDSRVYKFMAGCRLGERHKAAIKQGKARRTRS